MDESSRSDRAAQRRLGLLGLGSALCYLAMALIGDLRAGFAGFLALNFTALLLFALALRCLGGMADSGRSLASVLVPALLFRVLLLTFGAPSLSGDVHRYVWDGAVLASGLNPYRYPPAAPERAAFAPLAQAINHPEISTIYPPLAELVFAAAASLRPSERLLRVVLVLGELLVLSALVRALAESRRSRLWCLVWAWCPLAVVETALEGHLDALAIGLLLLGLLHLRNGRKNLSMWLLLASALVKLFALAVALACWRRLGLRRTALLFAAFAAAWLPFAGAGAGLTVGLAAYASRWQANAPLFTAVVSGLEGMGAPELLKSAITGARDRLGAPAWMDRWYFHVYPQEVARMLTVLVFVAILLWLSRQRSDPLQAGGLVVLFFLLLTPTLHPWYALWGLAFAPLLPSAGLLGLACLVPLAHAATAIEWSTGTWSEPPILLALEFLPFAFLLVGDLRARRFRWQEALP